MPVDLQFSKMGSWNYSTDSAIQLGKVKRHARQPIRQWFPVLCPVGCHEWQEAALHRGRPALADLFVIHLLARSFDKQPHNTNVKAHNAMVFQISSTDMIRVRLRDSTFWNEDIFYHQTWIWNLAFIQKLTSWDFFLHPIGCQSLQNWYHAGREWRLFWWIALVGWRGTGQGLRCLSLVYHWSGVLIKEGGFFSVESPSLLGASTSRRLSSPPVLMMLLGLHSCMYYEWVYCVQGQFFGECMNSDPGSSLRSARNA